MAMLAKLETKSNRVKGLSFHATRPWLLASLHNGVVQLWDYRVRTLLERFDEHDGPVRGVAFHLTQPMFVSGGDDYKIKVWNYKQRRCLFTLLGHLDYIRTVEFHREYPWILSASDDQTVRLWNWQSRSVVAVLSGHNHYVMSATFHPSDDLVASASLDQTIRVWDISSLRQKSAGGAQAPVGVPGLPGSFQGQGGGGGGYGGGRGGYDDEDDELRLPNADLFGGSDGLVKYVLEGHARGVNWVSFHPTSPLLVSGADDREVKLWRMNDTKAWEVDTFRGHFNNVSCVLFHPHAELVLSNSEDKTIRVWHMVRRAGIQTFRRENDRFWILAAHPQQKLFAAGHDSGLIVFKLERERPPFCSALNQPALAYVVADRHVRLVDFAGARDVPILELRPASAGGAGGPGGSAGAYGGGGAGAGAGGGAPATTASGGSLYRDVHVSAADRAALLVSDQQGGYYELYALPAGSQSQQAAQQAALGAEPKRGLGISAVFVGRRRFCVLEKGGTALVLRSVTTNEETKRYTLPHTATGLMPGPVGTVLIRSDDRIALFDLQRKAVVATLLAPGIERCVWSDDSFARLALLGKDTVIVTDRRLQQIAQATENVRVKSGAWDRERQAFIYTTATHIKFLLPSCGDSGIIRTLDGVLYVCAVRDTTVYCVDRSGSVRNVAMDPSEYVFKHALATRSFGTVQKMVDNNTLIGQAIIAYLTEKGFPEVALRFVRDPRTRFGLALQCGRLDKALDAAKVADATDCWDALAQAALRAGNHQIAEICYHRTKNFEKLSFLYLITGNVGKLRKMLAIAQKRGDVMSVFHNALVLGDVAERVRVLEASGQIPLAIVCAVQHGLMEQAQALDAKLTDEQRAHVQKYLGARRAPGQEPAALLAPPVPVNRAAAEENWPLLAVRKGFFDAALDGEAPAAAAAAAGGGGGGGGLAAAAGGFEDDEDDGGAGGWGGDDDDDDALAAGAGDGEGDALGAAGGGWGSDDGGAGGDGGDDDDDDLGGGAGGWGGDDDDDLGLDGIELSGGGGGAGGGASTSRRDGMAVLPARGSSVADTATGAWVSSSQGALAVDHAAAGSWASAMQTLSQQVGAVNFAPMKPMMMAAFTSSRAVTLPATGATPVPGTSIPLRTVANTEGDSAGIQGRAEGSLAAVPRALFSLQALSAKLKAPLRATTANKLPDAVEMFRVIIATAPFVLAATPPEVDQVDELVANCAAYVTALRIELARREIATADPARNAELAAYFATANLDKRHHLLATNQAMRVMFKTKCFQHAAFFARQLLELASDAKMRTDAEKVLQESASKPNALEINFDPRLRFDVCAKTFTPILPGKDTAVVCPLCKAPFLEAATGELCPTCNIAEIGRQASGLVLHASQLRQQDRRRRRA